jgi:hypothetical protein
VNDGWGLTRSFPIGGVWIDPPRQRVTRTRMMVMLLAAGAAAGGIVTFVLARLVP